jgi:predicted dehydrogenase
MLMPLLPSQGVRRETVVSHSGVSAAHAAKKFGFAKTTARMDDVLADERVDAVFITTPHHLHGRMVAAALRAGKHVFVEKPLALEPTEINEIEAICNERPNQCLMVGFNRRFSPHMIALQQWGKSAPSNRAIIITVNAGSIPSDHWTQDSHIGGGRIVGEACHFIDLARFLAGSPITNIASFPIQGGDGRLGDCVTIAMQFADGSTGTVHYLANGNKDFPKERVEVFAGGKVLVCDNFRASREIGGKRVLRTRKQDKGHEAELKAFLDAIRNGGEMPIPRDEIFEVSRRTLQLEK